MSHSGTPLGDEAYTEAVYARSADPGARLSVTVRNMNFRFRKPT